MVNFKKYNIKCKILYKMDRLIDKFYNGSTYKFGFGTVGSINPNGLNNKVMTPRPVKINYNDKNQTLLSQNRSQNNTNFFA